MHFLQDQVLCPGDCVHCVCCFTVRWVSEGPTLFSKRRDHDNRELFIQKDRLQQQQNTFSLIRIMCSNIHSLWTYYVLMSYLFLSMNILLFYICVCHFFRSLMCKISHLSVFFLASPGLFQNVNSIFYQLKHRASSDSTFKSRFFHSHSFICLT